MLGVPRSGLTPSAAVTQVMVADWSGAATHEERTLRVAVADAGDRRVTQVAARTRVGAADQMIDAASADPRLVVGLDFSFSMPGWWLRCSGISDARDLWAERDRLEHWLGRCDPPFWGRPGRRRPTLAGDPLRRTERLAPRRPGSVFQIGGAGAVGTASLRGMPTLHRLRSAGFAIWPFDEWRPPVVAEVWPRMSIGGLVKSRPEARQAWTADHGGQLTAPVRRATERSADALDAVAAALALCDRLDPRPAPTDPASRLEGWIDGVPCEPLPSARPRPPLDPDQP